MQQFIVGIVLGACIAVGSYIARFLTLSGSRATFLLAAVIYGVGGWKWTFPILTFFVLSSLLTVLGRSRKKEFEEAFEKAGARDAGQVFANGGVGGILAVSQYVFPTADLFPLYLGSVAAVTADTWGTELGLISHSKTYSIVTLKQVPQGTNGGVSLPGVMAGAFGALMIALSASSWTLSAQLVLLVVVAGVVGSFMDSLLGATIQAEYQCYMCGQRTERRIHCDSAAIQVRGFQFVNNDVVNWACAFAGAAITGLVIYLM